MIGSSWIQLFRRIPAELHNTLSVVSNNGLEVVIQSIVRLENDYAILRGRMAGTNDAGRLLIVPYDQMTFLGFNKRMIDPEIQAIFGPNEFAAVPGPGQPSAAPADNPSPPTPTPIPSEIKEPVSNGQGGSKPPALSKSILLARLRQRLAAEGK